MGTSSWDKSEDKIIGKKKIKSKPMADSYQCMAKSTIIL